MTPETNIALENLERLEAHIEQGHADQIALLQILAQRDERIATLEAAMREAYDCAGMQRAGLCQKIDDVTHCMPLPDGPAGEGKGL